MDKTVLKYGEYYHIFNRGNNSEVLFKETENYSYFLSLYSKYIHPIADTLAYCLMSNHFHIIIRIKEEHEIKTFAELDLFQDENKDLIANKKPTPSSQFSHLFNTYTKTINKSYNRTGSLFEHPFKRRLIENESYLQRSIAYVHHNPAKARIAKSIEKYRWSSYKGLISDQPTQLERDLVMKIFGNKDYFMQYHGSQIEEIEDFM